MPPSVTIRPIYEDNHLLVVDKPVGIATMGAESGPTVHSLAADYIRKRYSKPGGVFVGIVSRLDSMTSGVLVLARTSKAASRLTPQFGGNQSTKQPVVRADKVYLATVEGQLSESSGKLVDWVRKDDAARRMRVVAVGEKDAQHAELEYFTIGRTSDITIVAVRLLTGRKHQIRVQFASRGHALVGDRKYGATESMSSGKRILGIALHSFHLRINHPTKVDRMPFWAEPPKSWDRFASALPSSADLRENVVTAFALPPLAVDVSEPQR